MVLLQDIEHFGLFLSTPPVIFPINLMFICIDAIYVTQVLLSLTCTDENVNIFA